MNHVIAQDTKYVIPQGAPFNTIYVPTMDTVRNEYFIHELVIHGHHVLCTGETGTGKSVTTRRELLYGLGERFSTIFLNFSAQTSANQVCNPSFHTPRYMFPARAPMHGNVEFLWQGGIAFMCLRVRDGRACAPADPGHH